ncbi:DNA polymerase I [bacterium]|nr:DNA polymerase I [bacterium]
MTLPSKDKKIFLAIDANAIIHRAFHAYPSSLQTEDGLQVNAVYGFTTMLLAALKSFNPHYVMCAMDTSEPTFRHEMFADYKGTRAPTDQSLIDQFPFVEEVLNSFNIPVVKKSGFEADDILGTLSKFVSEGKWKDEDIDLYILSGDKDLLQLVTPSVFVSLPNGGFKNLVIYDSKKVKEKYGYFPEQVIDYKAIVGDSSDNIPGIKGVGDKSAVTLLEKYGNLDEIYRNLKDLSPRQQTLFAESIEQAEFSKKLATIELNMRLDIDLPECILKDFDRTKLTYTFKRYAFRTLVTKLDDLFGKVEIVKETSQLDMFNKNGVSEFEWSEIKKVKSDIYDSDKLYIAYISKDESVDDVPFLIVCNDVNEAFLFKEYEWVKDLKNNIIFYNWEEFVADISLYTFDSFQLFDVRLLEHLIKSEKRSIRLKDISFDYSDEVLGERISPYEYQKVIDILKLTYQKQIGRVNSLELYDYTKESIREYLGVTNNYLINVLKHIELPISCILAEMEDRGIVVDKERLLVLKEEVDKKLAGLEQSIYDVVGHEFNINSPKQLADVLFVELQLPKSRKLSTKESVLRSMEGMHPIIEHLLGYREVSKISSTYVEPLLELINSSKESVVHTDFKQMGTSSGRFSSVNPNMQNIPVSGEWAPKVRRCFVARKNFNLMAIDYSQMELRIMADIAKDSALTKDFINKRDIHSATAARVLGKDIKDVTKEERSLGKTINFGMIFGQTAYGLARLLEIDVEESSGYIREYFEAYAGVREYMKKIENMAKELGYVQTMFGTTRNVGGMKSKNRRISAANAREAINMPIQGSEADIMKYVMVKLKEMIDKKYKGQAYMLLQIHDEIVFEVKKSVQKKFEKDAKDIMLNSVKLDVSLDIHVSAGDSWDQLK